MSDCKECLSEKVCKYNDGHNLYCSEGYACPLLKSRAEFERFKSIEATVNSFWSELLKFSLIKKKETPTLEELLEYMAMLRDETVKEFAVRVHKEIHEALDNNYKVKSARMKKNFTPDCTVEFDYFIGICDGKINALRGIDDFIENLEKEMIGEKNEWKD